MVSLHLLALICAMVTFTRGQDDPRDCIKRALELAGDGKDADKYKKGQNLLALCSIGGDAVERLQAQECEKARDTYEFMTKSPGPKPPQQELDVAKINRDQACKKRGPSGPPGPRGPRRGRHGQPRYLPRGYYGPPYGRQRYWDYPRW